MPRTVALIAAVVSTVVVAPRTGAVASRTGVAGLETLGAGAAGLAGLLGLDPAFEREPGLDEEAGGRPEGAARYLAGAECRLSPGPAGRPDAPAPPEPPEAPELSEESVSPVEWMARAVSVPP